MLSSIKRWFKAKPEARDIATLDAILSGKQYNTVSISKEEALNIPAVSTSIDFIAGTIAELPIKLYRKSGEKIQEVTNDYRLKLLNHDTGDLLDALQFKKAIIRDMLLDGAGYAYIDKSGNKIKGLYYVDNVYVSVMEGVDKIRKNAEIMLNGNRVREFEVFRITRNTKNGVTGVGLLKTNPVLLNAMYNSLKFENTSVASGTKRGFLKSARRLEQKMMDELKASWRKLYSTDVNNSPDVMVLNEGISFEPAASTATENQLNELKKTNNQLIYSLFGLSESLLDSTKGDRDAYINNIKTGVLPIVGSMNAAINKFLLLEKEKDSLFFEIDTSELLKGTVKDRYDAYNTALNGGWMQVDEVRKSENLPPLGMDFVKMGLANIMYYPKDGKIYTPNTNKIVSINDNAASEPPQPDRGGISANDDKSIADTQNNAENGFKEVVIENED